MSGKVPSIPTTVPFLEGYNIKPLRTASQGNVIFTNGTDEIIPNQEQCEAYGYKFNKQSGVCSAFITSVKLEVGVDNMSNTLQGQHNSTDVGTSNTYVLGQLNTTGRESRNNIVVGQNNVVANSCQNSLAIGTNGNTNENSNGTFTIGGNLDTDLLGERQSIRLLYGGQTTGTANVALGLSNEAGKRFVVKEDSIIYFHAETIGFRTGGSSGTGAAGDYYTAVERGALLNVGGTTSIQRERDTIKTSGTVTNWRILAEVGTGSTLSLKARGNTNQTIEWVCNVQITELRFNPIA
jgi:hypothetical protein